MQEFNFEIIGTHLHLGIDTPHSCEELFHAVWLRLGNFEKKFSRFIEGNWLDTLNKNRSAVLDEDGKIMLSTALEVAKTTDGYFDPTIGARLSSLGYWKMEDGNHTVGYKNIKLVGDAVSLEWDVILEFWWVGKWYLLDVLRNLIDHFFQSNSLEIPRYIIDFWGDLYAYGPNWKIGLENPYNLEEVIGTIDLDNFFLACSSGSKRKWGKHHHLIDPKTGESSHEVVATFIEWPSGILVDSFATALCVMPFTLACETLFQHQNLEWVILSNDGRFFRSPGSKSEIFTT